MKNILQCSLLMLLYCFILSCSKKNDLTNPIVHDFPTPAVIQGPKLPDVPFDYVSAIENAPTWFSDSLIPSENKLTNDGATLGRVLFYDKHLSANNSVACASCHSAQNGFADSQAFSIGYNLQPTVRNAMAIINCSQSSAYFWDTRISRLETMVIQPAKNHIEMGMEDVNVLETKLADLWYYPALFKNAFGSDKINKEGIKKALAQYLRSMVTYNSRYDEGMGDGFINFTQAENAGRILFFNVLPCGKCHDKNLLGGSGIVANIGLDENYSDQGLGALTGQSQENGDFKIPSLRNIPLTAPYMHDGRFATLTDVIHFYNDQITPNRNLSFPLSQNATVVVDNGYGSTSTVVTQTLPVVPKKFNLTDQDISNIVAFLNTLTDKKFTMDEKFSDPFDY